MFDIDAGWVRLEDGIELKGYACSECGHYDEMGKDSEGYVETIMEDGWFSERDAEVLCLECYTGMVARHERYVAQETAKWHHLDMDVYPIVGTCDECGHYDHLAHEEYGDGVVEVPHMSEAWVNHDGGDTFCEACYNKEVASW